MHAMIYRRAPPGPGSQGRRGRTPQEAFLLVAVGALSRRRAVSKTEGDAWLPAREEIRGQLEAAGFNEGRDFVCVA
ncbi:MAG: hypothetical protein ACE5JI_19365 [Acidobacteriota bacterium]